MLGWLEGVIALHDELLPNMAAIQRELGRQSIAYHRWIREIAALWLDLEAAQRRFREEMKAVADHLQELG